MAETGDRVRDEDGERHREPDRVVVTDGRQQEDRDEADPPGVQRVAAGNQEDTEHGRDVGRLRAAPSRSHRPADRTIAISATRSSATPAHVAAATSVLSRRDRGWGAGSGPMRTVTKPAPELGRPAADELLDAEGWCFRHVRKGTSARPFCRRARGRHTQGRHRRQACARRTPVGRWRSWLPAAMTAAWSRSYRAWVPWKGRGES